MMPSRYPRIGVVRDPELSETLRRAASQLKASSEAGRLRELALIGGRSLNAQTGELEQTRRTLDELGASPEHGDLLKISRKLRRRPPRTDETRTDETASESLEWARGPR